jgi:hypothetical protein
MTALKVGSSRRRRSRLAPLRWLQRAQASERFETSSVPPWVLGSMCSIVPAVAPWASTTIADAQWMQRPTQQGSPRTSRFSNVRSVRTIASTREALDTAREYLGRSLGTRARCPA